MTLWVMEPNRRRHRLIDSFSPAFYVHGPETRLHRLERILESRRWPLACAFTERTNLWDGSALKVLQVSVHRPTVFAAVCRFARKADPALRLFNSDFILATLYCFEKRLFPLAQCRIEADAEGRVLSILSQDDEWALDYELPPFQIMWLKLRQASNENSAREERAHLEIEVEGERWEIFGLDEPAAETFSRLLKRYDPDLLVSERGDSVILPGLLRQARRFDIPLPLSRDPEQAFHRSRARSYASYGRILFKDSATTLFGRLHVDLHNSFIADKCELAGLWELVRLTKLPVQYAARTTTGTGISYMQMEVMYREGILIPEQKSEPEDFKRPDQLLLSDRGGLVFPPVIGFHENVAELDWPSMFPTIMAKFNVSSETLNCPCCPDSPPIPELGYRVCKRRAGIAGRTVAPLVEKRQQYKRRIQAGCSADLREIYQPRCDAAKWLLVCCFGYLGYKNARMGKIEAHEAINAIARESLLRAKETAEAAGFRILHAIVDSMYVQKDGATRQDFERLAGMIEPATGLAISLESIHRYIVFLPSKRFEGIPVPNRFFAVSETGKLKVRGLECRKHDTPPLVARMQKEALSVLSEAWNWESYCRKLKEARAILERYLERLEDGKISPQELVVSKRLTRAPGEYQKAGQTAIAAQQLYGSGVKPRPGENVQYIITDADSILPDERVRAWMLWEGWRGYDAKEYRRALLEAFKPLAQFSELAGDLKIGSPNKRRPWGGARSNLFS